MTRVKLIKCSVGGLLFVIKLYIKKKITTLYYVFYVLLSTEVSLTSIKNHLFMHLFVNFWKVWAFLFLASLRDAELICEIQKERFIIHITQESLVLFYLLLKI
jgi:hypothetical protein